MATKTTDDGSDASVQPGMHNEHLQASDEKLGDISDDQIPIDRAMQAQLNRKFDLHILPFLFGMWLLAFIDRTNVSEIERTEWYCVPFTDMRVCLDRKRKD